MLRRRSGRCGRRFPKPHLPELPFLRRAAPTPLATPTPESATPSPTPSPGSPSPVPATAEPRRVSSPAPRSTPAAAGDAFAGPDSGAVATEDVRTGSGKVAAIGQAVRIRCSLLGSGGETLGGSSDFLFMVGADEVAPGLDKAVLGMKAGGKRRATIPAALLQGPLPSGVEATEGSLRCEIELTEVL